MRKPVRSVGRERARELEQLYKGKARFLVDESTGPALMRPSSPALGKRAASYSHTIRTFSMTIDSRLTGTRA
jgi:hypothetical protein